MTELFILAFAAAAIYALWVLLPPDEPPNRGIRI